MERLTSIPRESALGYLPEMLFGSSAIALACKTLDEEGDYARVAVDGLGEISLSALPDQGVLLGTIIGQNGTKSKADNERETFLGMATHDIRAPLRNIEFLCQELLEEFTDPQDGRNDLIRKIRDVGTRAMSLSDEIVSAIQALGVSPTLHSRVEVGALCDMIFAMLDPEGNHDMKCISAAVMVEKPVLQIVLRNLIDNAIRHGGETQLSMRVDVEIGNEGKELIFSVTDTGKGFSDPALAFLSGGNLCSDSGFGLFGLRRLIKARGGTLSVSRPERGTGSVVSVSLPGRLLGASEQVARAS